MTEGVELQSVTPAWVMRKLIVIQHIEKLDI